MIRSHVDSLPSNAVDLALAFVRLIDEPYVSPKLRVEIVTRLAMRLTGVQPPISDVDLAEMLCSIEEPVGADAMVALTATFDPKLRAAAQDEFLRLAMCCGRIGDALAVATWWDELCALLRPSKEVH